MFFYRIQNPNPAPAGFYTDGYFAYLPYLSVTAVICPYIIVDRISRISESCVTPLKIDLHIVILNRLGHSKKTTLVITKESYVFSKYCSHQGNFNL